MPQIHCDNLSCDFNKKRSCINEDVIISNEAICMGATSFTDPDLDLNQEEGES